MKSISELDRASARKLRFVLADIDDTMTSDGKLTAEAYSALWRLQENDIKVIPVTGRPAGWCDLIIRQWPVAAVVGENGAFVYHAEDDGIRMFTHPSVAELDIRTKLDTIRDAVLAEVPGSRVAKDQFSRIYDLAIDFCEDPPYLSLSEAKKIKGICERFGAQAKISSIHVNTWFGEYDKLAMVRLMFRKLWQIEINEMSDELIFIGDSPNDEPMFAYLKQSAAVSTLGRYLDLIEARPVYITAFPGGRGFAEFAEEIIRKKGSD